jgi:8-oxo-dGTP pyrophosphatase MutT (NUDIX family)
MTTPPRRTRASVVCRHDDRLLTVGAIEPASGRKLLILPGGLIEPGEAPAVTAAREALEETGYRVTVDPASKLVFEYTFAWGGRDVPCRTHFFRARLADGGAPAIAARRADETYLRDVEWIPVKEIPNVFADHETIRHAVLALVDESHTP